MWTFSTYDWAINGPYLNSDIAAIYGHSLCTRSQQTLSMAMMEYVGNKKEEKNKRNKRIQQ